MKREIGTQSDLEIGASPEEFSERCKIQLACMRLHGEMWWPGEDENLAGMHWVKGHFDGISYAEAFRIVYKDLRTRGADLNLRTNPSLPTKVYAQVREIVEGREPSYKAAG